MEGVCSAQVQAQFKHSREAKEVRRYAMKKKVFCLALGAMLFALSASAEAQQTKKVWRIGHLSVADPATDSWGEAIRLALRELGYIEGENIAFEYRYTEGKRDRAPELATELVRLKVDIIVVAGGSGNGRCMFCPGSGTIQAQLGHGS
jgi:ABC-type uncharacterized transport system substrate-binding protein